MYVKCHLFVIFFLIYGMLFKFYDWKSVSFPVLHQNRSRAPLRSRVLGPCWCLGYVQHPSVKHSPVSQSLVLWFARGYVHHLTVFQRRVSGWGSGGAAPGRGSRAGAAGGCGGYGVDGGRAGDGRHGHSWLCQVRTARHFLKAHFRSYLYAAVYVCSIETYHSRGKRTAGRNISQLMQHRDAIISVLGLLPFLKWQIYR